MSGVKRWASIAVVGAVVLPAVSCALAGLVGLAVDGTVTLEVTEEIGAPPEAVFDLLDDADGLQAWWTDAMAAQPGSGGPRDGLTIVARGDVVSGPGTTVDFLAGNFTAETWTIQRVSPPMRVEYLVDFKLLEVLRTVELAPGVGGGTRVRWAEHGTITNPWMRLMASSMSDDSVKANFHAAIAALDRVARARADARLEDAERAARNLGGTLKARIAEALREGGAAGAITACSQEAAGLTALAGGEARGRVGRSSLRLRSKANAGPPWVTNWLTAQGERPAEGVAPLREIAEGKARVILPITVEPACLACHGPAESLAPDVRSILASQYPADAATGYAPGDLRGGLWAELPL